MAANQSFFPSGRPTTDVLLAARGFSKDGHRSGGIKFDRLDDAIKTIPAGALLLRLYWKAGDFGEWWFTPHEYKRIQDYFAVSGALLAGGRTSGKSAFHGTLALLSEWYSDRESDGTVKRDGAGRMVHNAQQIASFHVARVKTPVICMYGEGDNVSGIDPEKPGNNNYSRTIKPIVLGHVGGWARGARQVYLPKPWTYQHAFELIPQAGNSTEANLERAVASLNWSPLPFE